MHPNKKKALIAIKKAKTALIKIEEMIENDLYCWDIIVQNMAIIWLMKSTNNQLIEAFLENCSQSEEQKKAEIIKLFQLSHK